MGNDKGHSKGAGDRRRETDKETGTVCFACGYKDNFKRDCPKVDRGFKRNQGNTQAGVICFACGSKDHFKRD